MKLIIDIDEGDYHRIASGFGQEEDALLLEKIFENGTPIPDNATVCDIEQIRAEIEQTADNYNPMRDAFDGGYVMAIKDVLQIFDKYTAESEE